MIIAMFPLYKGVKTLMHRGFLFAFGLIYGIFIVLCMNLR